MEVTTSSAPDSVSQVLLLLTGTPHSMETLVYRVTRGRDTDPTRPGGPQTPTVLPHEVFVGSGPE